MGHMLHAPAAVGGVHDRAMRHRRKTKTNRQHGLRLVEHDLKKNVQRSWATCRRTTALCSAASAKRADKARTWLAPGFVQRNRYGFRQPWPRRRLTLVCPFCPARAV